MPPRRARVPVEQIPTARARKRPAIPASQLALALGGRVDAVYGYSFILTDINVTDRSGSVGWIEVRS